jgi:hypothetical protein
LIAIGAVLIVVVVSLGVNSFSRLPEQDRTAARVAAAPATLTVPLVTPTDEDSQYELTPTRRLPPPTNAPQTPGPSPTPLPSPTTYIPGPTAQFETLAPIEQWKTYNNAEAMYSIKYPPDWYLNTTPSGQTTQFFSYDFNDPDPTIGKGNPPPENFIKVEIAIEDITQHPDELFLPGETIADWVQRTRPLVEGVHTLIDEESLTVGGLPAFRQAVRANAGDGGTYDAVHVKLGTNVVFIVLHPYATPGSFGNQVFRLMLESFRSP